jgi:hypothetical protein
MAIKQKLMANQRVSDLEMACEHTTIQGPKRSIRQTGNNNNYSHQREPRAVRYPQQSNSGQNGNQNSQSSPRGPNAK